MSRARTYLACLICGQNLGAKGIKIEIKFIYFYSYPAFMQRGNDTCTIRGFMPIAQKGWHRLYVQFSSAQSCFAPFFPATYCMYNFRDLGEENSRQNKQNGLLKI